MLYADADPPSQTTAWPVQSGEEVRRVAVARPAAQGCADECFALGARRDCGWQRRHTLLSYATDAAHGGTQAGLNPPTHRRRCASSRRPATPPRRTTATPGRRPARTAPRMTASRAVRRVSGAGHARLESSLILSLGPQQEPGRSFASWARVDGDKIT